MKGVNACLCGEWLFYQIADWLMQLFSNRKH